ncbi:Rv1355c family protein [Pedobacter sp. SYP-B3415]|uniref:Rv1355c family protein n=1 Tax=Pedobacter sp. SYP-B3415 TaxID=2496641 RepID=UPI00101CB2BC|nr:Rv1355c family protein [Pedobacter sp. SYP-B3415]
MKFLLDHLSKEDVHSFEPQFFRIYREEDRLALESLLKDKPFIHVHDELSTQLDDLIKLKRPKAKPADDELEALKTAHIGAMSMLEYGVWVYYPWSERLVHLLDEEEFVEVRTNRNIYKITPEERDKLGRQKIGVVGLSVGQSISITMAMERSFGEIRLADFDLLELTNLNRIRTGVHNLAVPKVVIVAREIKEIDPFLKVTCYTDGMTEENMADFFTKGGNLDIVVDECDGLDIKILLRYMARDLKIPVVMDTSDRGTLDVERFDLEPDRPLLHGMIDHLDHTQVKYLKTNEDKVPFLLAMIGIDTISTRLKASMVEVGQSISTWPQLASSVTLGGALGADVCRRIILDQYHESGRYFVDLEDLVGDKNKKADTEYEYINHTAPDLTFSEMESLAAKCEANSANAQFDQTEVRELVAAAALAPSGGNTQPWKWLHKEGKLFLFHDEKQSASWLDYKKSASYVALGAAIENLKIKASELGLNVREQLFPVDDKKLIAVFAKFTEPANPYLPELQGSLAMRLTNRKAGNQQPLTADMIQRLTAVVGTDPLADLQITTDQAHIRLVADVVSACERLRFMLPQGHYDFYNKEIRWTSEKDAPVTEGLDIRTLELSETDKTGLLVASNPDVIKLLNRWGGGAAFEKLSKKSIASSSAIGLISLPAADPENFIKGGQALERSWLLANATGLALQPLTAPLFMFARLLDEQDMGMPLKMAAELRQLQDSLQTVFSSLSTKQGIFMFRLSYADEATIRTLRKPIDEILHFSNK